ncbi:chemotaxis protein CheW [Haliea sp. E17]|uniref:chemotaxis protein CheW n=1 Tax=Haliea sp. E17 TaxID=3401576 RepID=UPI003AAC7C26
MSARLLQSFDELERRYNAGAVAAPARDLQVELWVGTCLSIAGVPLLVAEGELEEIIETPKVTRIPGTKPWVQGVGSHLGGPIPVISGDVFFRKKPYAGRPREYCMLLKQRGFYLAVTLSGLERDLKFPVGARDMALAVDPDFAAYTLGGFVDGERNLAILDIERLLADSDFANAAESETITHEVVKHD